jgi:hypothetical protein
MSLLDSSAPIAETTALTAATAQHGSGSGVAGGSASAAGHEQAAAALVELSGASTITAAALVRELAGSSGLSTSAQSALFTLLDHDQVLALAAA